MLDGFSPAEDETAGRGRAANGSGERFGAEQPIRFHRTDGTTFVAEARAATVGHPETHDALALIRVIEVAAEPASQPVSPADVR